MATYALVHGAGASSWYWHLVKPELEAFGHYVVAPDLPCDDDAAGLCEYADVIVDAIGGRSQVVLVAQSLAGLTAPLVAARAPVEVFCHDLTAKLAAEAGRHTRDQSLGPFQEPWPLPSWHDVPTRFLACTDDRFFPLEFQRRVVRERLGIVPDEMDGGHLPALGHPHELVQRLEAYRAELVGRQERSGRSR